MKHHQKIIYEKSESGRIYVTAYLSRFGSLSDKLFINSSSTPFYELSALFFSGRRAGYCDLMIKPYILRILLRKDRQDVPRGLLPPRVAADAVFELGGMDTGRNGGVCVSA